MSVLLQPPPTAEELALKEQVTQVLSSQGVLAKLKAELRAAVFEVMHEREGFVKASNSMSPKLSDFAMETRTTALSLIVECLQFFHWDHALRVLRAETNAEDERYDTALMAKKLGLVSTSPSHMPVLFQLLEARTLGGDQTVVPARAVTTVNRHRFDEDDGEEEQEESQSDDTPAPTMKSWEQEELPRSSLLKEDERREQEAKEQTKDEEVESSAEIEESMAEEVPSGSELEESNFTNYEEESQNRSAKDDKQPTTLYSTREESQRHDESQEDDKSDHGPIDEDVVSLAAPPPAPAKLPSLPSLMGTPSGTFSGDADDDFDADEEAERLRKLDAALQAMEADDDTGTLQQLKASLQMELQEQDSFLSSGGLGKEAGGSDGEEQDSIKVNAETKKPVNGDEEDEGGYGSSDFEEEEEIASDISEEMESMPELSDKEDESEDKAAVSVADAELPRALRNDTRVDSEDALNSYDYIEDVEKSGW